MNAPIPRLYHAVAAMIKIAFGQRPEEEKLDIYMKSTETKYIYSIYVSFYVHIYIFFILTLLDDFSNSVEKKN